MKKESLKNRIIEEICKEHEIEKKVISYDWITILKKGNIEKRIVNYKLDINSSISEKIANDKYSTYELLKYHKVPIIEHKVLFNEAIMPEYGYVNDDFNILKNNEKVVIKANQSSQGKDVFLCEKQEEKLQIVKNLFEQGIDAVSICPYLEIDAEYRVFCVSGEVEYIYKKQKPFIIGDGTSNVKQLIEKDLKYLEDTLEDIDFSYIPKKEEKVIVGWKHNLSQGAIPFLIDENEEYYEEIKEVAKKTANIIDLDFAAIDVVVTNDKKVLIMETNPNFGIVKFCELIPEGYEIVKKIYEKAIIKIFEGGK